MRISFCMIIFLVYFRAKKARIGLEQAISEALEALEMVSSLRNCLEIAFTLRLFVLFCFHE